VGWATGGEIVGGRLKVCVNTVSAVADELAVFWVRLREESIAITR